ncbi:MAG: hypothetical protein AAF346_00065 [Pseudomonadota bacterium]
MADDAFEELKDVVVRLQRLTGHRDGLVSVQINSEAWEDFSNAIRHSPTMRNMVPVEHGQGADGRGKRFEFMGVEFADYNRLTGLSSTRK